MADTNVQECIRCGNEDDCINGICQNCFIEIQELEKSLDEARQILGDLK